MMARAIIAAFIGLSALTATTGTASAASCTYIAMDSAGQTARAAISGGTVMGFAKASHESKACDRARRECNRRLDRSFQNGGAGRGARCFKQT